MGPQGAEEFTLNRFFDHRVPLQCELTSLGVVNDGSGIVFTNLHAFEAFMGRTGKPRGMKRFAWPIAELGQVAFDEFTFRVKLLTLGDGVENSKVGLSIAPA